MFVSVDTYFLAEPTEQSISQVLDDLRHAVEMLSSAGAVLLAATELGGADDPHIILRTCYSSERDLEAGVNEPRWRRANREIGVVDGSPEGLRRETLVYERGRWDAPNPDITGGIWRALVFTVLPGVDQPTRRAFENDMALAGTYISTIRNWALSPIIGSSGARRWDYIFEQDFDDVDGLLGEYRMHPVHWGLVDAWFDPDHPQRIIDSRFRRRLICASPVSAIAPPSMASMG